MAAGAARTKSHIKPHDLQAAERDAFLKVNMIPTQFGKEAAITVDSDQLFLLYASFCGDVQRAAYSAGVPVSVVEQLVKDNGWEERVRGLAELKKTDKAGEVERGINRAMNFVQAHRYRLFLERVLRDVIAKDEKELYSLMIVEKHNKAGEVIGTSLSFKPLSDLAAALEKVHWMTYEALCDTPSDRAKRKTPIDEETSETDIHARIAKALAEMRAAQPLAQLKDAQEDLGKHLAANISALPATLGESPVNH